MDEAFVQGLIAPTKLSAASRRVFVVFKNFPRLRRGFIVVQRSIFLSQIFTVFALKKLKISPVASRRGLVISRFLRKVRSGDL